MTSRIAVAPDTLTRMREFGRGLDSKNNDEVINFLLDSATGSEEQDIVAGLKLRDAFKKWKARKSK